MQISLLRISKSVLSYLTSWQIIFHKNNVSLEVLSLLDKGEIASPHVILVLSSLAIKILEL